MIDSVELDNLVSLFDDRDRVVTDCVTKRLHSFGHQIIRPLLMRSERESDEARKELIFKKADELNIEFRIADLEDFLKRQKGPLSLFECSFIISSIFDCTLQREPYEDRFFKCSGEYLAEHSDQRTGFENIRIFNHIFFNRLGFNIYDVDITKEEYALLGSVLKTKKGNPFATAYIYLMIAQIAGLPLKPLCFPGGFVPVYCENGKELFYVNVYRGGEIFLKDRLKEFLNAIGMQFDPDSFRLRDENALTTIYLESLLFLYSNKGDEKKCTVINRALDLFGQERFLTLDEEDM